MPPRTRTRPTRQQTRTQLIAAAAAVFDEDGFGGASLDRIAERAGLTRGAIYSNFGGKDELFEAVVTDRVAARIEASISAILSASAGPDQALRAVGDALTQVTADDPAWHTAFVEYWVRSQRNPELAPTFRAGREAVRDTIAETLRVFAESGTQTLALSPDRLAIVILALSNGLAIEASAGATDLELFGDVLACLTEGRTTER